jgi:type VI secretion system secreted protein Hcp
MGGGLGAGKVNVQDVSFTKYVDKSSPELFLLPATASTSTRRR